MSIKFSFISCFQDATLAEVKRAFRSLSIQLHPDKNAAEDADVQFRNLVSVYEVIKDTAKREKYDSVLKNGLPNWRSAVYYYRKARKMGLLEGALLIFVITTIGQYFVSWAVYIEKKYTMVKYLMLMLTGKLTEVHFHFRLNFSRQKPRRRRKRMLILIPSSTKYHGQA